ncbi:hypothetical protein BO86DRAFT_69316 [Aspergillus japonicus CBS 114.51]|uniref:Uncharacterized protein n=1 Tax=Aspergillus japonicus CBS 114.51 TaxID=1448312 RepID=A0A8T8X2Z7_ASPJA|nr:hypothetical protein BO86DRAFT_69316 [Aspergillus japonicus CBS 114.51]RAH82493.1 hypothetical protein BO86DRAFT_69316 [Aspergillus japonicus CBS 114.51]
MMEIYQSWMMQWKRSALELGRAIGEHPVCAVLLSCFIGVHENFSLMKMTRARQADFAPPPPPGLVLPKSHAVSRSQDEDEVHVHECLLPFMDNPFSIGKEILNPQKSCCRLLIFCQTIP